MLHRQERLEIEGSPAIPPPDDMFVVEEGDENFEKFAETYSISA